MQDQDGIRRRAYEIWEQEGRPEGRHEAHWAQASREMEERATPAKPESGSARAAAAPGSAGATPAQAAAGAEISGATPKAPVGTPDRAARVAGPGKRRRR